MSNDNIGTHDEKLVAQLHDLSRRLRPHARHSPASDANATARAWSDVREIIEWFAPYREHVVKSHLER
jgi:oligoribonuclease (3'-5' exoribonuclease)